MVHCVSVKYLLKFQNDSMTTFNNPDVLLNYQYYQTRQILCQYIYIYSRESQKHLRMVDIAMVPLMDDMEGGQGRSANRSPSV